MHPTVSSSGVLANWNIVAEEARKLLPENSASQNFLAVGPKFVHKIIVLAADPTLADQFADCSTASPLEEQLSEKYWRGSVESTNCPKTQEKDEHAPKCVEYEV